VWWGWPARTVSPAFGPDQRHGMAWFSFSLIPCLLFGVGVAGWNITIDSWLFLGFVLGGFGTLLGPEETPVGVFLWLLLAWTV
jgi:hypothetical protein